MDSSLRKLASTGCPPALKAASSGRMRLTFPKFILHPAGSLGLVQATPLVSVPFTTFWSMLMVLSSCRLRTCVYSASNTELLLRAQVYPRLNSSETGFRKFGSMSRPTLPSAADEDGRGKHPCWVAIFAGV